MAASIADTARKASAGTWRKPRMKVYDYNQVRKKLLIGADWHDPFYSISTKYPTEDQPQWCKIEVIKILQGAQVGTAQR